MFQQRHDDEITPKQSGRFQQQTQPRRYKMCERMFDIGEDYWIETEDGRRAFKVDGKALRLRDTLNIEGLRGEVLCQIQGRVARVHDSIAIERNGQEIAEVHKDLVNIICDYFRVDMVGCDPALEVSGSILDHEYEIMQGGHIIAEISKKWLRLRDTYTVHVTPGQDDALILAITVAVDQLAMAR